MRRAWAVAGGAVAPTKAMRCPRQPHVLVGQHLFGRYIHHVDVGNQRVVGWQLLGGDPRL
jgi:hypothetical protein